MKLINCSVIESPSTDWSFWRKVIDRNKYKELDINTIPDSIDFCNSLSSSNDSEKTVKKIKIIRRIGSPSADGEVYHVQINNITSQRDHQNIDFALKLMPRIDHGSESRNKNEIDTAITASKYPDYFPIAFAHGFCDNSSYYLSSTGETSSFINKAIEYHKYNSLLDQITPKNTRKRFDSEYRAKFPLDFLANKYNLSLNKTNEKRIDVDFMLSELANGDLGNWMMLNRDIQDWKKILNDIVTGTYYLTIMVGKVLPDLHPGNILILQDPLKALIHDFGRCYPVSDEIPVTFKATLLSFCNEFLSCSTRNDLIIPVEISIKIQDILNILNKKHIDRNNIKDIYENLIIPIASY